ncbi:hypothetical protein HRbin17_02816 [bacterium HR17]|uniref:Sulfur carrier protein ThiS n=1 Tax=Candidatus Fervidibacter japonicus TaxID=2035412 RepID=A0A2H5XGH9_9BACT|nr:hypothetical protein HRbin17_02816 [bacterium HR17]
MPIVIKLNGKETELPEGATIGQLLDSRKIRREMVTVQVNGAIIDRSHFDTTALKDGDEVEFLYYMGGGTKTQAGGGARYAVIGREDTEGGYMAAVPALPGCVPQGQTRREAGRNVRKALAAYIEAKRINGKPYRHVPGQAL